MYPLTSLKIVFLSMLTFFVLYVITWFSEDTKEMRQTNLGLRTQLKKEIDYQLEKSTESIGVPKRCYQNVFHNYVIVMNFNYPNYDRNDILRDLYKGVFGVILTCGPQQKDQFKKGPDIFYDDGNWFFFRYLCLTLAMEKYPGYSGYFYSNDDLIVNWWNLVKFNTSNIWEGAIVDWRQKASAAIIKKWYWWNMRYGKEACQRYYELLRNRSQSNTDSTNVYKKTLYTYLKNGDGLARCSKGWSDMFYVPGRLRNEYILLSKLARRSNLILEIAVGNILRSMDYIENMEQLNGMYLPDLRLGRKANKAHVFWKIYNLNMTFIHPIKFYNNDSELTISLFKNFVLPYSNLLSNC